MDDSRERLDQLLEFPASFTFRVVARAAPGLRDRCVSLATDALGRPLQGVKELPSKGGRFVSLRLQAQVHESAEVTRVYAALGDLEGLELLL